MAKEAEIKKVSEAKVVKVFVKNVTQSPLKLRLVADVVRGKDAKKALEILQFLNKKGSLFIKKAILSGIAAGDNLYNATKENLVISKLTVGEGTKIRKFRFASRGRVSKLFRRKSHINLEMTVQN